MMSLKQLQFYIYNNAFMFSVYLESVCVCTLLLINIITVILGSKSSHTSEPLLKSLLIMTTGVKYYTAQKK